MNQLNTGVTESAESLTQNTGSNLRGFLKNNSFMSNLVFLMMVMVAFIVLLRLGVSLTGLIFAPPDSPYFFEGMVDAKQLLVYPQDPSDPKSITVYRSVNSGDGVEFTWSVWIFIDNLQYGKGQFKNIFYKGNSELTASGVNTPMNSPGLYISPNTNELVVMMNTFKEINKTIHVPNIPLNKWVNVIMRCRNTVLDVYINGTVTRSIDLGSVPRQNYGEVYVANNGGFDGYISNLRYHNYALGTMEIDRISSAGPNTTLLGDNGINAKNADYLSLRWFFFGAGNMFNPPKKI